MRYTCILNEPMKCLTSVYLTPVEKAEKLLQELEVRILEKSSTSSSGQAGGLRKSLKGDPD
jgi:hypothetical protein